MGFPNFLSRPRWTGLLSTSMYVISGIDHKVFINSKVLNLRVFFFTHKTFNFKVFFFFASVEATTKN